MSQPKSGVTSIDEQLALWLVGDPRHNTERDECCPDFSCCQPELLAPLEARKAFVEADEKTRHSMLMGFLSAALAHEVSRRADALKVHVAGLDDPEATRQ